MNVLWPNFKKRDGLVVVVTQDHETKEVLMVAYANAVAYVQTLATGIATYWSTSRNELWVKGATSGDALEVQRVLVDCDSDALVYEVRQLGKGACHTGAVSCFFRDATDGEPLHEAPRITPNEMLSFDDDLVIHERLRGKVPHLVCTNCGTAVIRCGTCWKCLNCGNTGVCL